jgi:hypothetical protein
MGFRNIVIALHNLSFKKTFLAVFILSLGLSIPLITVLLKNETTIFSQASVSDRTMQEDINQAQVPYPKDPPQIMHVTKFYGKPGDSILIFGKNFGRAKKESTVFLGNKKVRDSEILYWSDEEIEIALPDNPGVHKIAVDVNQKKSIWFGKVNIYTTLTPDILFIDEHNDFIRSPNKTYDLKVYTLAGNIKIFGAGDITQEKRQVPLELIESDILYVEVMKDGKVVPFKVENP